MRVHKVTTRVLVVMAMLLLISNNAFAGTVKVGVLKFGTVNWELKALKTAGFDKQNGFDLEIVPFAGGDATKIALQGGAVDIIVSDWLWVSRQRANGVAVSFVPYSSSVGAMMVAGDSDIKSLADLKGKKLGVAGGPLDKSWLLLQGLAKKQHGLDLAAENEIVFGAPPLLAEKTRDGELDGNLNYWHYCARLEADGYKRLVSVEDATTALGASGPISSLGYVFNEAFAADNPDLPAFTKAIKQTKQLLAESDEQWDAMAANGIIKDKGAALFKLRDRFREGIPARDLNDEIRDAEIVYQLLEDLGGAKLVGDSAVLVDGTFWEGEGS